MRTSWITRIASLAVIFTLLAAYPVQAAAPTAPDIACIYNVNANAMGANNGSSWANAYTDLQAGINAATNFVNLNPLSNCQVWVARGTYFPSSGKILVPGASFRLNKNVQIYGGFNGTEGGLTQRNLANNPTYLSGFIGFTPPLNFINSLHVVTANAGTDSSAVLDGFYITMGDADGSNPDNKGGGIYLDNVSPTLNNLVIQDNIASFGGGVYLENSSPTFTNVVFYGNMASARGGALYVHNNTQVLNNVTFNGNTAPANQGGALYDDNTGTVTWIKNSIMWGDTGGEVVNAGANPTSFSFSVIQGCKPGGVWQGPCGADNISSDLADVDPVFVDQAHGNLRLRTNSPVIDKGNDMGLTAATDLDSNPRIMGTVVDLGAYEMPVIIYVNGAAAGPAHNGKTWATAYTDLQAGLTAALAGSHNEVWVASGTYKPSATGDRAQLFDLRDSVGLYGGFTGSETARTDRDWTANPTILSGDLAGDDGTPSGSWADNTYTVVRASNITGAILDGFTVQRGNNINVNGMAGGIYVFQSSALLSNLVVQNNQARYGGGIYDNGGLNVTLTNVTIQNNFASVDGGGLEIQNSSPALLNVIVSGNWAGGNGGGMVTENSSPTLINVTIGLNAAFTANGISISGGSPLIQNSILWSSNGNGLVDIGGTPTISHSLIRGCNPNGTWVSTCGTNGGGNVPDSDPLFVDPSNNNMRVHYGSPAVDAGSNALASRVDVDVAGDNRIVNGTWTWVHMS